MRTRPISPVVRMAKLTSLTPRWSPNASRTSRTAGTRQFAMTTRFANGVSTSGSVVDIEIHAGVQARDLVRVPVEHQRGPAARLADPLLGGLTPAWMIVIRVHVAEEPVLGGRQQIPRRRGLR